MNAAEHAEAVRRLDAALEAAGVRVVTPIRDGARITGWLPVSASGLIGRWLAAGWRVELEEVSPPPGPADTLRGPGEVRPPAPWPRLIP